MGLSLEDIKTLDAKITTFTDKSDRAAIDVFITECQTTWTDSEKTVADLQAKCGQEDEYLEIKKSYFLALAKLHNNLVNHLEKVCKIEKFSRGIAPQHVRWNKYLVDNEWDQKSIEAAAARKAEEAKADEDSVETPFVEVISKKGKNAKFLGRSKDVEAPTFEPEFDESNSSYWCWDTHSDRGMFVFKPEKCLPYDKDGNLIKKGQKMPKDVTWRVKDPNLWYSIFSMDAEDLQGMYNRGWINKGRFDALLKHCVKKSKDLMPAFVSEYLKGSNVYDDVPLAETANAEELYFAEACYWLARVEHADTGKAFAKKTKFAEQAALRIPGSPPSYAAGVIKFIRLHEYNVKSRNVTTMNKTIHSWLMANALNWPYKLSRDEYKVKTEKARQYFFEKPDEIWEAFRDSSVGQHEMRAKAFIPKLPGGSLINAKGADFANAVKGAAKKTSDGYREIKEDVGLYKTWKGKVKSAAGWVGRGLYRGLAWLTETKISVNKKGQAKTSARKFAKAFAWAPVYTVAKPVKLAWKGLKWGIFGKEVPLEEVLEPTDVEAVTTVSNRWFRMGHWLRSKYEITKTGAVTGPEAIANVKAVKAKALASFKKGKARAEAEESEDEISLEDKRTPGAHTGSSLGESLHDVFE